MTEQRKVYAVSGATFVHETLIRMPAMLFRASAGDTPNGPLPTARCVTRRPDLRCECGMFDLEWT